MFNCAKLVRFSRSTFRLISSYRPKSSLAPTNALKKCKELPEGITLEVLDTNTHDLGKLRKLLVDAFILNQEPIMHTLCERTYPDLPTSEKLIEIEGQFEKLFTDQFLSSKIEQGRSLVAIDKASDRYISSGFVESYNGRIYGTERRLLYDPFWKYGLRLMDDLHKQSSSFLSQYKKEKIAFLSHGATCPEYTGFGIVESMTELFLAQLACDGFEIAYAIAATKGIAEIFGKRFGLHPIVEIPYADYEIDGVKVFAHLADKHRSACAVVKFL